MSGARPILLPASSSPYLATRRSAASTTAYVRLVISSGSSIAWLVWDLAIFSALP